MQRSVLTGDELSPVTQQVLSVLDLSDMWEQDPSATPGRIVEMPGALPEWHKRVASTELYHALAKRASSPSQAHTLYLEAVLRARAAMAERLTIAAAFDPGQRLLAGIYNRGLARVLVLGQKVYGHPATWTSFARLEGQEPVRFRRGENLYEPADFDSYLAAEELMFSGRLHNRYRQYGVGAAMIGVCEAGEATGREFAPYELPNLQTMPVTAVLDVTEVGTIELLLLNSFETASVEGELGQLPLAADFTAPPCIRQLTSTLLIELRPHHKIQ